MAYGTVIKMCDRLNLNPVDFSTLEQGADLGKKIVENRVMQQYVKLNKAGRKKILDMMGDFSLGGALLVARIRAHCTGHVQNAALLKKILEQTSII